MTSGIDAGERFQPGTLDDWRAWLAANHTRTVGVWLVTWQASAPGRTITYEESVEQALCFGWVDSKAKGVDAERTMLWFAPRRARSGWARPNKQRIERLTARLLHFDATAWGNPLLDPYNVVSSSLAAETIVFPPLRFVCKADELAFTGTETIVYGARE